METKESLAEFVKQSISECQFDVDVNFCIENNVKFDNHEVDSSTVDLFNREANIRAFDFIFKNR